MADDKTTPEPEPSPAKSVTQDDLDRALEALRKERAEGKDAKKLARALPSDFDLDEYLALKAEREKRETEQAEKKGEFDRLLKKREDELSKEIAARDSELHAIEADLYRNALRATVAAAAAKLGALDGTDETLALLIERQTKLLKDKSGVRRLAVVDADGDDRNMTVEELLAEMRDLPHVSPLFRSSGVSGSGASSVTKHRPSGDTGSLTPEQKIARGLEAGATRTN